MGCCNAREAVIHNDLLLEIFANKIRPLPAYLWPGKDLHAPMSLMNSSQEFTLENLYFSTFADAHPLMALLRHHHQRR